MGRRPGQYHFAIVSFTMATRGARVVGVREIAPVDQRDAQRGVVPGPDLVVEREDGALVRGSEALHLQTRRARPSEAEGSAAGKGERLDAGQGGHAFQQAAVEGEPALRRVAGRVEVQRGQHHAARLEAGVDEAHVADTADEQARADEEKHGQRHLRDGEGVPQGRLAPPTTAVVSSRRACATSARVDCSAGASPNRMPAASESAAEKAAAPASTPKSSAIGNSVGGMNRASRPAAQAAASSPPSPPARPRSTLSVKS